MSINYPTFTPTNSDSRHNEEDAAWLYERTFALNPSIDITLHLNEVAREWRRRAKALYTDSGKKAKAMSSELLTPRVRRLITDLHLSYALFEQLDRPQRRSLHKLLSIPRRASINMLYGLPAQVVRLPCYLDYSPRDITYDWLVEAVRKHNPLFEMNQARGEQIFTHIYRSEYRGTSKAQASNHNNFLKKAIPANLDYYRRGVSRSRDLLCQNRAAEYAEEQLELCINGKVIFPINQNFHHMILSDAGRRLIPLARLPLNNYPGIDFSRLYKIQPITAKLNFWHMFKALNPWVLSECQTSKDKICDETLEIAANSNWADMFKTKVVVAPVSAADNTKEIAREDAADITAIIMAQNPPDNTAAHAADNAADNAAENAANCATVPSVASELVIDQAGAIGARGDETAPTKQIAFSGCTEEKKIEIPPDKLNDTSAETNKLKSAPLLLGIEEEEKGKKRCDTVHNGRAKASLTEVIAKSDAELHKACDHGQSRKRKGGAPEFEVEDDEAGANASDEVLPLTKKYKTEDDGIARDVTAVRGKSPAFSDDSTKES